MTKEEKELLKQVQTKLASVLPSDWTFDDLDFLKVLVEARAHIFPKDFVSILLHPNEDEPRNVARRLVVIMEAFQKIPDGIREEMMSAPIQLPELLPTFSLEKKELQRVLTLCAEMRDLVWGSDQFDQPHKVRLLNRIAAIEREAQKPQGFLDVLIGGVSDVGEAVGKFGDDIAPLTDRIKEVFGIARGKSREYDQLPLPEELKRLPPPRK